MFLSGRKGMAGDGDRWRPHSFLLMFASSIIILLATTLIPSALLDVNAFISPNNNRRGISIQSHSQPHQRLHARGTVGGENDDNNTKDEEEDDDDERDVVYAKRRSGRRGKEEGSRSKEIYDNTTSLSSFFSSSSPSSSRYQNDVEFFDLDDNYNDDDDELFDDDDELFDGKRSNNQLRDKIDEIKYNGIIPNPLLDAMDPDGVYERLGPELFNDWTFFRDMALFALFLTFFTGDTHLYGTFDSVIERLEDLPADFIPMN
jgi:hypothetical protein